MNEADAPHKTAALTEQLRESVEKGAGLLDELMPGWAGRVNTEVLEMKISVFCVLGQLGDGWPEKTMCALLGLSFLDCRRPGLSEEGAEDFYPSGLPLSQAELRRWAVENGFDVVREMAGQDETWEVLGDLWADQVRQRRLEA